MNPSKKIAELKIDLPEAPDPVGSYVAFKKIGNLEKCLESTIMFLCLPTKYNEKEVNYIGKRVLSDLPNDLHKELLNKDAGQSLDIREIGENLNLILICDRKDDVGLQVSREAIEDNIYSQKIGMMSRRYLRDLRRDAVIEYR